MGKLLIFSAPSGSGKTTIVHHLINTKKFNLEFSVSATSREARVHEVHGKDYYFLSPEDFKNKIDKNEFIEWEEVYTNNFYGTLKSEIERIWEKGNSVIFDVDVIGGLNIKKQFGDKALAIFVQPPSVEELKKRLTERGTESEEKIKQRLDKAEYELDFASKFDVVLVNDNLEQAKQEAEKLLNDFLNS